jgi:hypothetical protein
MGIGISFPHGLLTPESARRSGRHFMVGAIRYSDVDGQVADGELVWLKPVLSGAEPLDVLRYAASTRKGDEVFPQQPTWDQFFNEAQFESYRMLGLHTVMTAFPGLGGWPAPDERAHGPGGGWPWAPLPQEEDVSAPPLNAGGGAGAGGDGLFASTVKAAESMGQQALLATAITVGGVVGVTGTVALRPGTEVSLNAQDRDMLKKGVQLVQGPPAAPPDLKTLETNMAQLSAAMAAVSLHVTSLPGQVSPTLAQLGKHVDDLGKTVPTAREVHALREQLGQLQGRVNSMPDNTALLASLGTVNSTLTNISTTLGRIDNAVKETVPRRNMRAVGEGAAR